MSEDFDLEVLHSQYAEAMRLKRQWIAQVHGKTLLDAGNNVRRFKDYDTALKAARKALQSEGDSGK